MHLAEADRGAPRWGRRTPIRRCGRSCRRCWTRASRTDWPSSLVGARRLRLVRLLARPTPAAFALPTYQSGLAEGATTPAASSPGVPPTTPGHVPEAAGSSTTPRTSAPVLGSTSTPRPSYRNGGAGSGPPPTSRVHLRSRVAAGRARSGCRRRCPTRPATAIRLSLADVKGISDDEVARVVDGQPTARSPTSGTGRRCPDRWWSGWCWRRLRLALRLRVRDREAAGTRSRGRSPAATCCCRSASWTGGAVAARGRHDRAAQPRPDGPGTGGHGAAR
jgi:hypothetical protein